MFRRLKEFFINVRTEFKKVSWPTRNELVGSTMVVIISVFFLSVFVGICDFICARIVAVLLKF